MIIQNRPDSCPKLVCKNLKTSSSFYGPASGAPTIWTTSPRVETYGYDSALDFLTSANYNDGLANASPTWSYDAAANRTDSVCDNLNRTTSIGGVTTTTDTLGNRLTLGSSTSYSWDALNRMTSLTKSGTTTNYEYRADGMRTHKLVGSVATEYVHDGQMPVEDSVINGSTLTVTRYGLGARGMDYMEKGVGTWTSSTSRSPVAFSTVAYPLYDAHGNMIATISRGSTTLNDVRTYDAWGSVRQGSGTGDPKNRYCASLGHQQDDESGLVYMRARYYEPGSGRFVSEDPARQGQSWFQYCNSNPIAEVDKSGKNPLLFAALSILWGDYSLIMQMIVSSLAMSKPDSIRQLMLAQSEIAGFDLNVTTIEFNYYLDGIALPGTGNMGGAEFCENMGEASGIVGRALVISLEESLQMELMLVLIDGAGSG